MNLGEFLIKRQKKIEWEGLKHLSIEDAEVIDGQQVYHFRFNMDRKLDKVNDNLNVSQQPYGSFVPWHFHDYMEIMYVYQGNCTVLFKDERLDLTEGNLLLIDKRTSHKVERIQKDNLVINLVIKRDYLTKHLLRRLSRNSLITNFMVQSLNKQKFDKKYLLFETTTDSKPIRIVDHILREYYEMKVFSEEFIDSLMILLFIELLRGDYLKQSQLSETKEAPTTLEFLRYIEEHYQTSSLPEMAQHFNYHPNYLSSRLKQDTGKSYKELVQIQKMTIASILLSSTDLSIEAIVEHVGYSSVGFFYKKFKEFYGTTPVNFRKNL